MARVDNLERQVEVDNRDNHNLERDIDDRDLDLQEMPE
jgi:hypothetical protein